METHPRFMRRAIDLARAGMAAGEGGPFGAVVVREGRIVGEGCNQVLARNDPTAHGEIVAIRDASRRLETFNLDGCLLYTTGQPCPMCLGAIYWARIRTVYYGFSIFEAAAIGFDDVAIYEEFALPPARRQVACQPLLSQEAVALLEAFRRMPQRPVY
jgi:tRNA(Arg) A34 adenosine deaminase TadA